MKLLNLGCGANRPSDPKWTNIDNLHKEFPSLTNIMRIQMDKEPNYLNHDLSTPMPFESESIDGIFASHLLEHLDIHESLTLIKECYRVLKLNGVLRLSVPDPIRMFRKAVKGEENWGEPNHYGKGNFMEAVLFMPAHKPLVTSDVLRCMFWVCGFRDSVNEVNFGDSALPDLAILDNRPVFSVFMEAIKC
jgi:predicted SAM-dependent methyltransferase